MTDDFEDRLRAGLHRLADPIEPSPWQWTRIAAGLKPAPRRSFSLVTAHAVMLVMVCLSTPQVSGLFQARLSNQAEERTVGPFDQALPPSTSPDDSPFRPSESAPPASHSSSASDGATTKSPTTLKNQQTSNSQTKATAGTAPTSRPQQPPVAAPPVTTALPPPSTLPTSVSSTSMVMTVPSAPRSVTAVAGNASAKVDWQAPISAGTTGLTAFVVTGGPIPVTVGPDQLSATVTGLTKGQSYVFTVRARNTVGDGPESEPSLAVTPSASPGPRS